MADSVERGMGEARSAATPRPQTCPRRARALACSRGPATTRGGVGVGVHRRLRPRSARITQVGADRASSPRPTATGNASERDRALFDRCGVADQALRDVARLLVDRKASGLAALSEGELSRALRAAGEPHVWPRAWIATGHADDRDARLKKLEAWRSGSSSLGVRRCGAASRVTSDGPEIDAVVDVDALADLAPLPTHLRTGQWLEIDATLLVVASSPRLVVLGPHGPPRTAPVWIDHGHLRARFTPDSPGAYSVQLLADVSTGPRPVLEARVFDDVDADTSFGDAKAPGEAAAAGARDEAGALVQMIAAVRSGEGLPVLKRDARLDAIALAHARRMAAAKSVGHDLGDGDPTTRLRDAEDLTAGDVGENVARAASVTLAHRSIYASPSHRTNLLRARFDGIGVAVVDDPAGGVWVVELMTSGVR